MDKFTEKIISNAVERIKGFGCDEVDSKNIFTTGNYPDMFRDMLIDSRGIASDIGHNKKYDEAIEFLIEKIDKTRMKQKEVELNSLLGKRVLVSEKSNFERSYKSVQELKVIEISPSCEWVKVMNDNGRKHWIAEKELVIVEVLKVINRPID